MPKTRVSFPVVTRLPGLCENPPGNAGQMGQGAQRALGGAARGCGLLASVFGSLDCWPQCLGVYPLLVLILKHGAISHHQSKFLHYMVSLIG